MRISECGYGVFAYPSIEANCEVDGVRLTQRTQSAQRSAKLKDGVDRIYKMGSERRKVRHEME